MYTCDDALLYNRVREASQEPGARQNKPPPDGQDGKEAPENKPSSGVQEERETQENKPLLDVQEPTEAQEDKPSPDAHESKEVLGVPAATSGSLPQKHPDDGSSEETANPASSNSKDEEQLAKGVIADPQDMHAEPVQTHPKPVDTAEPTQSEVA